MEQLVSVVLGTYNRLRFLKMTIATIRTEMAGVPHEIIVVDGGSSDGTLKWLMSQKDIILIVQHNRGTWAGKEIERRSWGYFMNLGFKCARGKYICMLSDDCLVVPGAIRNGYALFEDELAQGKRVGAVAFYWRNWPEQSRYWVGLTFGNRLFVNHGMYLQAALKEVGFLDEDSFFFYHADSDLCLRMAELGYSCICSPESFIEHYSHANEEVRADNLRSQSRDWLTYTAKWEHLGLPETDWVEKEHVDSAGTARMFKRRWFDL